MTIYLSHHGSLMWYRYSPPCENRCSYRPPPPLLLLPPYFGRLTCSAVNTCGNNTTKSRGGLRRAPKRCRSAHPLPSPRERWTRWGRRVLPPRLRHRPRHRFVHSYVMRWRGRDRHGVPPMGYRHPPCPPHAPPLPFPPRRPPLSVSLPFCRSSSPLVCWPHSHKSGSRSSRPRNARGTLLSRGIAKSPFFAYSTTPRGGREGRGGRGPKCQRTRRKPRQRGNTVRKGWGAVRRPFVPP